MCPPAFGGGSKDVNAGNVLNKNIFDPWPSVIFSSSRIIECIRAIELVMIGTKKLGKPKCVALGRIGDHKASVDNDGIARPAGRTA